MAVHDLGASFGVVRDEIERHAGGAGGSVGAMGAVIEKLAQKSFGAAGVNAGGRRPADLGVGDGLADSGGGEVIKAVVLLRSAVPIGDVRLVPHFPVPVVGLRSVAAAEMSGVGEDEIGPL